MLVTAGPGSACTCQLPGLVSHEMWQVLHAQIARIVCSSPFSTSADWRNFGGERFGCEAVAQRCLLSSLSAGPPAQWLRTMHGMHGARTHGNLSHEPIAFHPGTCPSCSETAVVASGASARYPTPSGLMPCAEATLLFYDEVHVSQHLVQPVPTCHMRLCLHIMRLASVCCGAALYCAASRHWRSCKRHPPA